MMTIATDYWRGKTEMDEKEKVILTAYDGTEVVLNKYDAATLRRLAKSELNRARDTLCEDRRLDVVSRRYYESKILDLDRIIRSIDAQTGAGGADR